jgi:hypothetical protein
MFTLAPPPADPNLALDLSTPLPGPNVTRYRARDLAEVQGLLAASRGKLQSYCREPDQVDTLLSRYLTAREVALVRYTDGPWRKALFLNPTVDGMFQHVYCLNRDRSVDRLVFDPRDADYLQVMEHMPPDTLLSRGQRSVLNARFGDVTHPLIPLARCGTNLHEAQAMMHMAYLQVAWQRMLNGENVDNPLLGDIVNPRAVHAFDLYVIDFKVTRVLAQKAARLKREFMQDLDQSCASILAKDQLWTHYTWLLKGRHRVKSFNPRAQLMQRFPLLVPHAWADRSRAARLDSGQSVTKFLAPYPITRAGLKVLQGLPRTLIDEGTPADDHALANLVDLCNHIGRLAKNWWPEEHSAVRVYTIASALIEAARKLEQLNVFPHAVEQPWPVLQRWFAECARQNWTQLDVITDTTVAGERRQALLGVVDFLAFVKAHQSRLGVFSEFNLITWLQRTSLADLARISRRWHRLLPDARLAALARFLPGDKPGVSNNHWPTLLETTPLRGFVAVPLNSVERLRMEALNMRNCVDTQSYEAACRQGRLCLFSIRSETGQRFATVSFTLQRQPYPDVTLSEIAGPANAKVSMDLHTAAEDLAEKLRWTIGSLDWVAVTDKAPRVFNQLLQRNQEAIETGHIRDDFEETFIEYVRRSLAVYHPKLFGPLRYLDRPAFPG